MNEECGRKYLCTSIDEMIEALEEVRDQCGNLFVEDEKGINQIRIRMMRDAKSPEHTGYFLKIG